VNLDALTFTVYGIPQPAGSKRAFFNRALGRALVTDANPKARPWKALVSDAAIQAMRGRSLLDEPLILVVDFFVARPKGHFRTTGQLRPKAPAAPAVRPDLTKLLRAVEDACTGIVWRDDAQVVDQHVRKIYGEPSRCELTIKPRVC